MTTTMSEAFDAPMTDSGDIDISMYSGITTTDSWHSMEEDVEIEMGDDDEAITEYEMADEGDGYGEELQDVEVYDISQVASPLLIDEHGEIDNPYPEDTVLMQMPSDDHPVNMFHPGSTTVAPVVASETYNAVEVPVVVDLPNSLVVVHNAQAPYDPDPVAIEPVAVVTEDATTAFVDIPGVAFAEATAAATLTTSEDVAPPLEEPSEQSLSTLPQPTSLSTSSGDHQQEGEYSDDTATAINPPLEAHAEALEGAEASVGGPGDPHEISDGVYIDPPPAVLLSLPPAVQYGECSLFNLPTSSVPQSPSSSAKTDTGGALHLLLHERPTLYYEPLSAVFQALRQETFIQNMPGFAEAELILDAYDLQLAISEDNVYTHEVTLHELNVIHDGSDLSGPLRLRLKVFSPRFVTRYTTLRDQIARLNLTGDGDASHADALEAEQHREQEHENEAAEHALETEASSERPAAGAVSENAEYATDHTESTVDDAGGETQEQPATDESSEFAAVQQQAEADIAAEFAGRPDTEADGSGEEEEFGETLSTGGPVEDTLQASTATEGTSIEDSREDTDAAYEESEETLDADDVHSYTAHEEGGDYVEHAEFPDDEDEFGEDLPEELGGQAREQAYLHTSASEGPVDDQASFAENASEVTREELNREGSDEGAGHGRDEERSLSQQVNTDAVTHFNSSEGPDEDTKHEDSTISTTLQQAPSNAVPPSARHDDTLLIGEDDFDDDDDWDDGEPSSKMPEGSEALSRKSSTTTLASRTSKRAYDEVELDDFDDDEFEPTSPDVKRPRVE